MKAVMHEAMKTRIQLVRELATGGMGRVYEARMFIPFADEFRVAVKLMRGDRSDRNSYKRFGREVSTAMKSNHAHPNLLTTFWCSYSTRGRPFLVMEYVVLSIAALAAKGPLSMPVIRRIARDVARALAYLHQCGVVHGDVSAGNIMMSGTGAIKLGDFGLARRESGSESGRMQGTPAFLSPEAYRGASPGPEADAYSLGAVLYTLIMGKTPYGSKDFKEICAAINKGAEPEPLPPELDDDLAKVVNGLMEGKVNQRLAVDAAVEILEVGNRAIADDETMQALLPASEQQDQLADNTEVLLAGDTLPAGAELVPAPGVELDAFNPEALMPRSRWRWLPWAVAAAAVLFGLFTLWSVPEYEPVRSADHGEASLVDEETMRQGLETEQPTRDEKTPREPELTAESSGDGDDTRGKDDEDERADKKTDPRTREIRGQRRRDRSGLRIVR